MATIHSDSSEIFSGLVEVQCRRHGRLHEWTCRPLLRYGQAAVFRPYLGSPVEIVVKGEGSGRAFVQDPPAHSSGGRETVKLVTTGDCPILAHRHADESG